MNTFIFTVYDSAARMYLEPFCAPSVEFAIREFRSAVNKVGHQFQKYPGDYTLFAIGEFDPETGKVNARDPSSLGVAITFVDVEAPRLEDLRGIDPSSEKEA